MNTTNSTHGKTNKQKTALDAVNEFIKAHPMASMAEIQYYTQLTYSQVKDAVSVGEALGIMNVNKNGCVIDVIPDITKENENISPLSGDAVAMLKKVVSSPGLQRDEIFGFFPKKTYRENVETFMELIGQKVVIFTKTLGCFALCSENSLRNIPVKKKLQKYISFLDEL